MSKYPGKIYGYLVTLPDRLYPFASKVEGRWVRGQKSYLDALERAVEQYGPNRLGYKLVMYRATFHLIGSITFLICSAWLAHHLFGSEVALYTIVFIAIIILTIQEFYLHPKKYGQLTSKSITDWLTWVMPFMIYLTFSLPS